MVLLNGNVPFKHVRLASVFAYQEGSEAAHQKARLKMCQMVSGHKANHRRWDKHIVIEKESKIKYKLQRRLPTEQVFWKCPRCDVCMSKETAASMGRQKRHDVRREHMNKAHPDVTLKEWKAMEQARARVKQRARTGG